ncbi:MAG: carboxypeptidase regulatory-like domain-containing protein [Anaerolineae bacterium]
MAKDTTEPAKISGKVVEVKWAGIAGVTVSAEDQTATATTAADGTFTLTDVTPGFVYLYAAAPSSASCRM